MSTDGDFNQAFQSFARRENLPSAMTSEEWSTVPSEIRERAFFSSRVMDAEILQRLRDGVEDVLSGRKGQDLVEKELFMWLRDKGYEPPAGKAGGLEDLSSLRRLNVIIQTNVAMAYGHASWVRAQTAIRLYPCQELVRVSQRKMPREWEAIWSAARDELSAWPGVHPTEMIALINHPIWMKISRFNNPYPPFDFGSGMGVKGVRRDKAKALGFELNPDDPIQQPQHRSMNDGLEVTPDVADPTLKEALTDKLGRFGEWDGKKLIFTDPDGTKKYPADKLAEIWKKPAPEGYDRLTQKDVLDDWDGGQGEAAQAARIKLRQLLDRIETLEQPAELWRAIELKPAAAFALIRGLTTGQLQIPGNVAGWDWVATQKEIGSMTGTGWRVLIRVQGVTRSIDIRALRPVKPGFVYVGGTTFKIDSFTQDSGSRRLFITVSES